MNTTRNTDDLRQAASAVPARLMWVYGLVAVAFIACWPASISLYQYWTDVEDLGGTHGPLLLGTSLYLIFRARNALASPTAHPSALGFAGLVACSLAWLVLFRAGIEDLQLLLIAPLIWLAACAALGPRAALPLVWPVGLLVLALPGWGHLAEPLQFITTQAVGVLATVAGVPVFIERTFVTIPSGVFEVAGGCSGVHFLVVGLALSAIHGEVTRATLRRRLILMASMTAIALVVNWIRVFAIVLVGHLTKMQHSLVTDGHYWFGWTLFAVSVIAYIWIANRSDPPPATPLPPASWPDAARPAAGAAAAMLLLMLPAALYLVGRSSPVAAMEAHTRLPGGTGPWHGPHPAMDPSWKPEFAGAHRQVQAAYRDSRGAALEVTGIVYRSQRQGAELVSEGNKLFGSAQVATQSERVVTGTGGTFREAVIEDASGTRFVVWSVYDIGGQRFVVPLLSQLWYGARSLVGKPTSVLLVVRARCGSSCNEARELLDSFLASMSADLIAALAATGQPAANTIRSAELLQ